MTDPKPSPPPGPAPAHFPAPWASDWGEDRFGLWQGFTYQGVRQGFRWIPPTPEPFLMGSPEGELGRYDDERQHPVLLSRGFWMAETACTQALWRAVAGQDPSKFKGDARPVEQVSWDDVQGFVERLNAVLDEAVASAAAVPRFAIAEAGQEQASQSDPEPLPRLRLPTEAEWEYACRAGTSGPFSFGDDITPEQANYDGNAPYRGKAEGLSRKRTVAVASLPPNPWGLYEMHGNVWEWCWDWFGDYSSELATDPTRDGAADRCRHQ